MSRETDEAEHSIELHLPFVSSSFFYHLADLGGTIDTSARYLKSQYDLLILPQD